jgi:hypothetical protein
MTVQAKQPSPRGSSDVSHPVLEEERGGDPEISERAITRRGFLARAALSMTAVVAGTGLVVSNRIRDRALPALSPHLTERLQNLSPEMREAAGYRSDPELNATLRENLVRFLASSFTGNFITPGAENQYRDGLSAKVLRNRLNDLPEDLPLTKAMRYRLDTLVKDVLEVRNGCDQIDRLFAWIGSFPQDETGRVSVDAIATTRRIDASTGESLEPELERLLGQYWGDIQQLSTVLAGIVLINGPFELKDV